MFLLITDVVCIFFRVCLYLWRLIHALLKLYIYTMVRLCIFQSPAAVYVETVRDLYIIHKENDTRTHTLARTNTDAHTHTHSIHRYHRFLSKKNIDIIWYEKTCFLGSWVGRRGETGREGAGLIHTYTHTYNTSLHPPFACQHPATPRYAIHRIIHRNFANTVILFPCPPPPPPSTFVIPSSLLSKATQCSVIMGDFPH